MGDEGREVEDGRRRVRAKGRVGMSVCATLETHARVVHHQVVPFASALGSQFIVNRVRSKVTSTRHQVDGLEGRARGGFTMSYLVM